MFEVTTESLRFIAYYKARYKYSSDSFRPLLRSDTGISQLSDGTGPVEMKPLAKSFTFRGSPNEATWLE